MTILKHYFKNVRFFGNKTNIFFYDSTPEITRLFDFYLYISSATVPVTSPSTLYLYTGYYFI